jgi:uncharacterized membrane protein
VLAALLVGAALLLFIASNWEEIPRLARLIGIVALIWGFYLGGAYCLVRGRTTAAAGLLVVGTLSFGGAMSLVGQMYNLSGDELMMVLVWFVAACTVALMFRSGIQVVVAGLLAWAFCGLYLGYYDSHWTAGAGWMPWAPPVMAAIILALVRYADAPVARHLAYLMVIGWLIWLSPTTLHTAVLFAAFGMAAFLAVSLPMSPLARLSQSAGAAPAFYAFLLAAIGLFLAHIEIESGPRFLALGGATLTAAVVAIVLAGRDNGAVRYLAYAMFAGEVLYIANQTVGSIIGTSGFFLVAGIFVAIAAWLVIRLERRFSHPRLSEAQS